MGWAVSFDGLAYIFCTQQHAAIVSADQDWPVGGPIILRGCLLPPTGSFTERMRPLDGDLDVDDLNFRLFDPVVEVGPAAGYNVVTWLGTRKASYITTTQLAEDLTPTGPSPFGVDAGGAFGTGAAVLHVDREAILVNSRSSNDFTVNAFGRGWFGTRAVAHQTDPGNSYYPAVKADFPGFTSRRAILWHVDDTDVATPVWRGYVTRGPRFAGRVEGADEGTVYELQCTHAWAVEREVALGLPDCATRLRGYDSGSVVLSVSPATSGAIGPYSSDLSATDPQTFGSFEGAAAHAATRLADYIASLGYTANYTLGTPTRSVDEVRWKVESTGVGALTAGMKIGGDSGSAENNDRRTFLFITSFNSADPRSVEVKLPFVVPPVMYQARHYLGSTDIPVTTTFGFPSSWAVTTYSDGGHTTTVRPILRGELGDTPLAIYPTSVASSPPVITGAIRAVGQGWDWTGYVDTDLLFVGAAQIFCTHWVFGLKRGVFEAGSVRSGADPRNWNWDYAARIAQATASLPSERTWLLDGRQKLGEFVVDVCAVNGCGLAVRDSRLSAVAYQPSLATDGVAATFTAAAGTGEVWNAQYEPMEDGLANKIELDADTVRLVVNDQRSVGSFGQGRTVSLRLTGTETSAISADPAQLAQTLLSRVIGLWSAPVALGRFTTSWGTHDALRSVRLGDTVEVTEWLLPAGDGTRGFVSKRLFVVGRTVDFDDATVTLEGVAFDEGNLGGYAPCVRAASAPDEFTIEVATGYLNSGGALATTVSDYANSDADEYTGTPGDGGANKFAVGDAVRLILRNSTTLDTVALTVADVYESGGSWFVEFTGSMGSTFEDYIALGQTVDLIPGDYSATSTDQREYCAVGDNASPSVIDGTANRANTFAP